MSDKIVPYIRDPNTIIQLIKLNPHKIHMYLSNCNCLDIYMIHHLYEICVLDPDEKSVEYKIHDKEIETFREYVNYKLMMESRYISDFMRFNNIECYINTNKVKK